MSSFTPERVLLPLRMAARQLSRGGDGRVPIGDDWRKTGTRPSAPRPSFAAAIRVAAVFLAILLSALLNSCSQKPAEPGALANDPHMATNGTVEVTAKLLEIPEGAIFKRDLYDYATILKYQVLKVHRGKIDGDILYVGHYNPWKSRAEATDKRVPNIGGNLRQFQAGQTHRLALEVPIEDYFMGGIVNKYFGKTTNVLYWATWTNEERR